MAIIVPISSTWDPKGIEQAVKDINKAGQKLNSISSNTKQTNDTLGALGNTFKKLGVTVAATFGAREIGQFFSASIKGAIEDERSLRVLNKTLENMGFRGASAQVNEFVTNLQFASGIADDQLRPALNNLVLATGNLTKSQELLQIALNVSASTGRDLDSITIALAKAYNGNFNALKKLNLGIDESLIKNKDLSAILTVLSNKFAGASANAVDTYAGKIQILRLAVGEAQETIGYALLDALDRVAGSTKDFAYEIQNLGTDVADIITGASVLITTLQDLASSLGLSSEATSVFETEQADLGDRILQMIPIVGTYLKLLKDRGEAERLAFAPATATPAQSRLLRQARENEKALKAQTQATEQAKKAQEELKKNTESLNEANKNYAQFVAGTGPKSIEGATLLAENAIAKIQSIMGKHPKINDDLVKSFRDLTQVIQTNFNYALEQARTKLANAQQQYDNFKQSIKSSITGVLQFTAIEEGSTFLDTLTKQSEQAKKFGSQIQQLLLLGLNQQTISDIANAGFDVGSRIADEIIAGGATVVNQVNTLVASVQAVGETVSTSLADTFYSAGVNSAQQLVDGIINQINASAPIIAQAIANATAGNTTTVPTVTTQPDKKKDVKTPPPSQLTTAQKIVKAAGGAQSTAASRSYTALAAAMGKIKLAQGGIVMGPTNALIGEAGPEAVIPLTGSRSRKIGVGGTYNITVNAGIGTSGAQVGREIVDAIRKFERSSGQVFARV